MRKVLFVLIVIVINVAVGYSDNKLPEVLNVDLGFGEIDLNVVPVTDPNDEIKYWASGQNMFDPNEIEEIRYELDPYYLSAGNIFISQRGGVVDKVSRYLDKFFKDTDYDYGQLRVIYIPLWANEHTYDKKGNVVNTKLVFSGCVVTTVNFLIVRK